MSDAQTTPPERLAVEALAEVRALGRRRLFGAHPRSTVVAVMPRGVVFARCVYPSARESARHGAAMDAAGWTPVERRPVIVDPERQPGVEVLWRSEGRSPQARSHPARALAGSPPRQLAGRSAE
jgi:hypothetical protein